MKTIKFSLFASLLLSFLFFVSCANDSDSETETDKTIVGIWALTESECLVEATDTKSAKLIAENMEKIEWRNIDTIQFLPNGYYSEHNYFLNSLNNLSKNQVYTHHTYKALDGKLTISTEPMSSKTGYNAFYTIDNTGNQMQLSPLIGSYFYSNSYLNSLQIDTLKVKVHKITLIKSFKRFP